MSEEGNEPTKYQKVKRHLKDNRKVYLVGAGAFVAGGLVTTAAVFYHFDRLPMEINQTAKNTALIIWKPEIHQIALVKKECRAPIPCLDKETGIPYPSLNEVARNTGTAMAQIRSDVHGAQERFERLPESVFA